MITNKTRTHTHSHKTKKKKKHETKENKAIRCQAMSMADCIRHFTKGEAATISFKLNHRSVIMAFMLTSDSVLTKEKENNNKKARARLVVSDPEVNIPVGCVLLNHFLEMKNSRQSK